MNYELFLSKAAAILQCYSSTSIQWQLLIQSSSSISTIMGSGIDDSTYIKTMTVALRPSFRPSGLTLTFFDFAVSDMASIVGGQCRSTTRLRSSLQLGQLQSGFIGIGPIGALFTTATTWDRVPCGRAFLGMEAHLHRMSLIQVVSPAGESWKSQVSTLVSSSSCRRSSPLQPSRARVAWSTNKTRGLPKSSFWNFLIRPWPI